MINIDILTKDELARVFKLATIKRYGEIEGEECLTEYYMLTGEVIDDIAYAQKYIDKLRNESEK